MRAHEFIAENNDQIRDKLVQKALKPITDKEKIKALAKKSEEPVDEAMKPTNWMGYVTYQTSGRTWNTTTSPTHFFNANSELDARMYMRLRAGIPKSARNLTIIVKPTINNREQEFDEQSPAANAKALVGSGRGPTGTNPKGKGDSPEHRAVRTPTTTYSKDRKKYNKGAPPGANDGFIGG